MIPFLMFSRVNRSRWTIVNICDKANHRRVNCPDEQGWLIKPLNRTGEPCQRVTSTELSSVAARISVLLPFPASLPFVILAHPCSPSYLTYFPPPTVQPPFHPFPSIPIALLCHPSLFIPSLSIFPFPPSLIVAQG